jgi:phage terminase Nu1 subunit (DNA packaging protein)
MTRTDAPPTSPYLTSGQVAELFGCAIRTVSRWTDEGRFETVGKLSGKTGAWLYDRDAIHAIYADADVRRFPKAKRVNATFVCA